MQFLCEDVHHIEGGVACEKLRLRTAEGNLRLLECVAAENICVIQPGCRLRSVLAEAERRQIDYWNSVKLSDIVRPGGRLLEITRLEPAGGKAASSRKAARR